MKNMRILAMTLIICLVGIMYGTVNASVSITADIKINYDNGGVTINGTASDGLLTVSVLKPKTAGNEAASYDLDDISSVADAKNMLAAADVVSVTNGLYTYQFSLPTSGSSVDANCGKYSLVLKNKNSSAVKDLFYKYPVLIKNEFNGADVNSIGDVMSRNLKYLGLDAADYQSNKSIADSAILSLRPGSGYVAVDDICEAIGVAIGLSIMNTANEAEMDIAITKYGDNIGLEIHGSYINLKADVLMAMIDQRQRDGGFADINGLKASFKKAMAVAAINNAPTNNDITPLLEKYQDVLAINLGQTYASLDKVEFNKAFYKHNPKFRYAYEITDAFNKKITEMTTADNEPRGPGNSGGGGGFSVGVLPLITPIIIPTPAAMRFNDVPDGFWAKEAITALAEKGMVSGVGQGNFVPDAKLTREQFVKMMVEIFKFKSEQAKCEFSDVSQDKWYYVFVASAVQRGLVDGISPNSFGTGQYITRQDMAVLILRTIKASGLELPQIQSTSFVDEQAIANYAKDPVKQLCQSGLISGMGDGSFKPFDTATRAQAAQIAYRLVQLNERKGR